MEELEIRVNKNGIKTYWHNGYLRSKECAICGEIIQITDNVGDVINGDWKDSDGVWHENHHVCKKILGKRNKRLGNYRIIPQNEGINPESEIKGMIDSIRNFRHFDLERCSGYRSKDSYKLCNDLFYEMEALKEEILRSRMIEREI